MAARTTGWPARYELASPVRWNDIAATVRAIAESSEADFATVTRLVVGLTEPLRQLDNVAALTARALTKDAHATAELKSTLVGRQLQAGVALLDDDAKHEGCGCGCDDAKPARPALEQPPRSALSTGATSEPSAHRAGRVRR